MKIQYFMLRLSCYVTRNVKIKNNRFRGHDSLFARLMGDDPTTSTVTG